jgi:protein TonB
MFEFGSADHHLARGRRGLGTVTTVAAHVCVLGLVALLPFVQSDQLPPPPETLTFVAPAVPVPPPPAAAPPAPRPVATTGSTVLRKSAPALKVVPAPVEAPPDIGRETAVEAPTASPGSEIDPHFDGAAGGVEGGVPGGIVGGLAASAAPPPPPPPEPTRPIRVGGQIATPALLSRAAPTFPEAAARAGVRGAVILEATVDKSGRVESVRVVRSVPQLEKAAIDAVKQWRYSPLLLNGEPMPFMVTVTVSFND